jgi:uncharacterized protein YndB with AHSA1/START domain
MKSFATSISIRAPAQTVWALLTDAAGYPQWNSTVTRIDGRIAAGEKVTVHAKVAPGRAFPLKVTEFAPPHHMVWMGGLPLGLFTGARRFTLTSTAKGEVEFAMREIYSGLLAALITRSIPDLQPAFDQFAADLKRRAESMAREFSKEH